MRIWAGATWLISLLMLAGGCIQELGGAEDWQEAEEEEDTPLEEKGLSAENGLKAINGLSSKNGLKSVNGLSLTNGLKVINGLVAINGLATKNGLTAINGNLVNCAGASRCTGAPDGLLSATTGLMKDADGVSLASYLVRCALPSGRTIKVRRWDGQQVSLAGDLGLAPGWESNHCTKGCQERVTSCLLALVNGSGQHVEITLSADWASGPLSVPPDPRLLQEAVFFGNIFKDPPEAYVAVGRDWARGLEGQSGNNVIKVPRMCSGVPGITDSNYAAQHDRCPIKIVGESGHVLWEASIPGIGEDYDVCFMSGNPSQALLCRLHNAPYRWRYPLTTFVSKRVW